MFRGACWSEEEGSQNRVDAVCFPFEAPPVLYLALFPSRVDVVRFPHWNAAPKGTPGPGPKTESAAVRFPP